MKTIKIYHNPRCSKSRETLQLLQNRSIEPEIIEYLKNPPSAEELHSLVDKLGITPRELIRTKEAEYRDQGLDDPNLSDEVILKKLQECPKLIERPIVVVEDRAKIGRPPEAILELL